MYSTCLFCHTQLGANEAIEHFSVGRRLAFDGAKGRLIAAISDEMFLPEDVSKRLAEMKGH